MRLSFDFRELKHQVSLSRGLLGVASLLALLVVRSAPPEFPHAFVHQFSVHAFAHHEQRPRFDSDSPQWTVPVKRFVPAPPIGELARLTPAHQCFSILQTKGFRYNRPPPAV